MIRGPILGVLKALEQGVYYCGFYVGAPMMGNPESEDMGKVENQMEKTMENEMGTTTYRIIWGLFWEQCRIKWKMVYNRGYAPYISNPLT